MPPFEWGRGAESPQRPPTAGGGGRKNNTQAQRRRRHEGKKEGGEKRKQAGEGAGRSVGLCRGCTLLGACERGRRSPTGERWPGCGGSHLGRLGPVGKAAGSGLEARGGRVGGGGTGRDVAFGVGLAWRRRACLAPGAGSGAACGAADEGGGGAGGGCAAAPRALLQVQARLRRRRAARHQLPVAIRARQPQAVAHAMRGAWGGVQLWCP